MYSRLSIGVWLVNSPVLDIENDSSVILNKDELTGLCLFPSSKVKTAMNGISTGREVEHVQQTKVSCNSRFIHGKYGEESKREYILEKS